MKVLLFVLVVFILWVSACKPVGNETNTNTGPGYIDDREKNLPTSKWGLWDNPTCLRGANIYQRRVYPELDGNRFLGTGPVGPPFVQEDFDRLSAMGANYVNISHPGIFTEKPPFGLSGEVLDNLQHLVEMAGRADMFVVISFRTGPGRSEFTFFWGGDNSWFDNSYYNDTIWTDPSAQDAWVEMWKETTRRFADNPYVVGYDLMVEPNSNDIYFDIWDPDDFYPRYAGTLYDWNGFYPRVTDGIREIDTEIPILIGGLSYSEILWMPHMDVTGDERTVYMFHQYDPHPYTHQGWNSSIGYPGNMDADYDGKDEYVDRNWLNNLLGTVDSYMTSQVGGTLVVGCNEFGVTRWAPGAGAYMDDLMDLFEQRGINYAIWEWSPSYDFFARRVDDFNFRFGPNRSNLTDVDSSDLVNVIKKYWSLNTYRPSNVNFE
ncbi:MAG: glycoside hydrolase family 5 protein [bacterium]|nr:glycoside hydrolase family 5 protein [bacterium]